MIGFRVWSKNESRMYYEGFFLDNQGDLYRLADSSGANNGICLNKVTMDDYVIMKQIMQKDVAHNDIYEKDILRYASGYEFSLEYGVHDAFCPGDKIDGTNEGFVAATYDPTMGKCVKDVYPLMDIEDIAICVGNTLQGYIYRYGSFQYVELEEYPEEKVMRAVFNDEVIEPWDLENLQIQVDEVWEDAHASSRALVLQNRSDKAYAQKDWDKFKIRIKQF